MAIRMKSDPKWAAHNIVYIYANSGKEREETLEFLDKCDKTYELGVRWVEAKVNPEMGEGTTYSLVTFETAGRNGEPFEQVLKKYGIANAAFPHCTRELKTRPINALAKDLFGSDYVTAIGIRADEVGRLSLSNPKFVYPMVEWWMTVADVRRFWNEHSFDLALKDYEGNCDMCWKKSLRKTLTLIKEDPSRADWWQQMEDRYGMLRLDSRADNTEGKPIVWGRKGKSVHELRAMAKEPFIAATDPFLKMSDLSRDMDDEQPCSCLNFRDSGDDE